MKFKPGIKSNYNINIDGTWMSEFQIFTAW